MLDSVALLMTQLIYHRFFYYIYRLLGNGNILWGKIYLTHLNHLHAVVCGKAWHQPAGGRGFHPGTALVWVIYS